MGSGRLTEAECVTTGGHKLLVSHDNSDGADNIHGPGTDIGNRGFLVALHTLLEKKRWGGRIRKRKTRSQRKKRCRDGAIEFSNSGRRLTIERSLTRLYLA